MQIASFYFNIYSENTSHLSIRGTIRFSKKNNNNRLHPVMVIFMRLQSYHINESNIWCHNKPHAHYPDLSVKLGIVHTAPARDIKPFVFAPVKIYFFYTEENRSARIFLRIQYKLSYLY